MAQLCLFAVLAFAASANAAMAPMGMAMAPAPGPSAAATIPTGAMTIGQLSAAMIAACPDLQAYYAADDFSTFLTLGAIASGETLYVPEGDIVAFTPTNDAFNNLLATGAVSASDSTNATLVGALLAQHVASVAGSTATSGVLLNGGSVEFQVGGVVSSLEAALAAAPTGTAQVVIMDPAGGMAEATIVSSASCMDTGIYAVGIADVLYAPAAAMAPVPAPAPAPAPVPVAAPAPAPSSATAFFSGAAAAMAVAVAALV